MPAFSRSSGKSRAFVIAANIFAGPITFRSSISYPFNMIGSLSSIGGILTTINFWISTYIRLYTFELSIRIPRPEKVFITLKSVFSTHHDIPVLPHVKPIFIFARYISIVFQG